MLIIILIQIQNFIQYLKYDILFIFLSIINFGQIIFYKKTKKKFKKLTELENKSRGLGI